MIYLDLITLIALAQFLFFGVIAGQARGRYGVKAPAITGHEMFERAYRVQMNTMELLIILLPALYISARYWPAMYSAIAGAVFVVGRFVYWRAYMDEPKHRTAGFGISIAPILVLLVASLLGVIKSAI